MRVSAATAAVPSALHAEVLPGSCQHRGSARVRESTSPAASPAAAVAAAPPWPEDIATASALDIASRVLGRQQQVLKGGGGSSAMKAKAVESQAATVEVSQLLSRSKGGMEVQMSELADHVALMQRQRDAERREVERRIEQLEANTSSRLARLEDQCKQSSYGHAKPHGDDLLAADVARLMQNSRLLVTSAVSEVEAMCKAHRAEIQEDLQGKTKALQDSMQKVEEMLKALEELPQASGHRGSQLEKDRCPPWFGELESAVAALEHRLGEQRTSTDAQLARLRSDVENSRVHVSELHDELSRALHRKINDEFEVLTKMTDAPAAEQPRGEIASLGKRMGEVESRLAALRVRVDVHDGRLSSMAERSEVLCQQAMEDTKDTITQLKGNILSEVECQLRLLRQRMDDVTGDMTGMDCQSRLFQLPEAGGGWSSPPQPPPSASSLRPPSGCTNPLFMQGGRMAFHREKVLC